MQSFVTLRKTGLSWEFETEEALENFLFTHLDEILGWTVIKRQYIVNGQRCDLLATDKTGRLVVIELKNVEDRGIVQQLTRYYHALLEEKPFSDRIDYEQPVNLVAIAPSFHRDNLTDRKYHKLEFEFFQFSILQEDNKFYLILKDIDSDKTSPIQIFYEDARESNLPCQPQRLRKFMTDFPPSKKETILRIREKILSFDSSIQEFSSVGSIKYGNGTAKNSKYCAEFLLDKRYSLVFFLWIPFKGGESSRIGRARIWSDWNDQALIEGYIASGIGLQLNKRKKAIMELNDTIRIRRELKKLQLEDPTQFRYNYLPIKSKTMAQYRSAVWNNFKSLHNRKSLTYEDVKLLEDYSKFSEEDTGKRINIIPSPYKNLDSLIDLALEKWLERV
ncbi:endonuclease NucS domain-containing protein [Limnoraphis robusta]|uniref:endonuclease NucS domain-containing protein n=1 Tax=Limnoraphis robusta TaxID=1118279 RepID=UPI002B1F92B5|nr:endonuclease NucS domain-containing protein [Limnoraphis robusta]MEA5497907.1 endonuclease NucS domain-containing protein [Limnoraphis robusta BA-68 BA1]